MKVLCVLLLTLVDTVYSKSILNGYFWQVTDFHYDANYSVKGNPDSMCHQGGATTGHSNSPYGNYLCDSPMVLIKSAIQAMKKNHPQPDFILWTGDSVPHVSDGELDQMKVYYNIRNVTEQLKRVFPDTLIYPVLGNHDEYPKDAFPAMNTTYYSDILSICNWSSILGEEQSQQFKIGGYYRTVTNTNLVLLGLNTNMYYAFDPLTSNSSDPTGQFRWLEMQLQQAKSNKQKVIIFTHIAPGLFELSSGLMWFYDKFNEKYVNLVSQYHDVITAQIYGHEHTDSFRILKDKNGNPINMLFLSPAVTPWKSTLPGVGSNNPSIRLYEYNRQTGEILNYHQYYLNLSKVITSNTDVWEKEYDVKSAYQLSDLSPNSFLQAVQSFSTDSNLFKKYLKFNSVQQDLNPPCNSTCQKVHFCSITELRRDKYTECMNLQPTTEFPVGTHTHRHRPTDKPKKHVTRDMVIIICTLSAIVFVLAVVVAILCIKRHSIFIPHRYSRFSTPLSKGPIN